jgi:hypothetical protein
MIFPSELRSQAAITAQHRSAWSPARADLVMDSAAAHRNGSLQSRRNKAVAGILEDHSDVDGGA